MRPKPKCSQLPDWLVSGALLTDGERLWEVYSLRAAMVFNSKGEPVSSGPVTHVILDDASLPVGSLQPTEEFTLSDVLAKMRPLSVDG